MSKLHSVLLLGVVCFTAENCLAAENDTLARDSVSVVSPCAKKRRASAVTVVVPPPRVIVVPPRVVTVPVSTTKKTKYTKLRLTKQQRASANDALIALRRIESDAVTVHRRLDIVKPAVQGNPSFYIFCSRFFHMKADVDEALRQLPKSSLKNELQSAIDSYASGYDAWADSPLTPSDPPGLMKAKKAMLYLNLGVFFGAAQSHTREAEKLVR